MSDRLFHVRTEACRRPEAVSVYESRGRLRIRLVGLVSGGGDDEQAGSRCLMSTAAIPVASLSARPINGGGDAPVRGD